MHADVMKIVCDKFPMVWNESETGALEKDLPTDLKSIQILREQINHISLEKVTLTCFTLWYVLRSSLEGLNHIEHIEPLDLTYLFAYAMYMRLIYFSVVYSTCTQLCMYACELAGNPNH